MSSVCRAFTLFTLLFTGVSASAAPLLRVCADPNNLPYSNQKEQGLENRLAAMIAADLGLQVSYYWFPQEDAFFRKTLGSGKCDVVMGVPAHFQGAETTRPYYRSSYVFVSRSGEHLNLTSLDDPRLKEIRVGVQVLGSGDDSLPPVYALASRSIVRNVTGYSLFGHSVTQPNPTADLIEAVERNDVDIAIAWGPTAGYFARSSAVPLAIFPLKSDSHNPQLQFSFDISVGVRQGDDALERQIDNELIRRRAEIERLLRSYGIPQLTPAARGNSVAEN
jgi:quinoprotein dehydrogenase-associated probable ABC transporter substrate-binding protein